MERIDELYAKKRDWWMRFQVCYQLNYMLRTKLKLYELYAKKRDWWMRVQVCY